MKVQMMEAPDVLVEDKADASPDVLASFVTEKFHAYKAQRTQLERKWDEWYRQWRCEEAVEDATKQSEKSRIKVPACKEAVNNATDSIFQIVCAANWFDIAPRPIDLEGIDPMQAQQLLEKKFHRSKVVKDYLSYLFDRENIEDTLHSIIQDMCIYGTGIGRIKATEKKNKSVKRTIKQEPVIAQDGSVLDVLDTEQTKSIEQTVNHPEMEHIPIENFYTNAQASGIQLKDNNQGVIVRSYKKRFEIKGLERAGVTDTAPTNDEIQQGRLTALNISSQQTTDDVELLEWWGMVPEEVLEEAGLELTEEDEEDGGREMCIVVADRQKTIKQADNPFPTKERPFVCCKFDKTVNEFYGIGIMEIAWGPQKALDATVRARIDNKALALNNIFAINTDKFIEGQDLTLKPGKALLFRGDPRESFMPIQIPDVTQNSDRDMAIFERFIQGAHGISPLIGGMPSKSGEQTATEVSSMLGQAATRIKTIVKRFEKSVVVPMLRWYCRIILQYINDDELFLLTDSQTGAQSLHEITPEDIAEDYEFVAMGSVKINEQNQLQKRMNALQVMSNPMYAQFVNLPYLLKKVYEAMGFDDTQAALMLQPPPQVQQMSQMMGPNAGQAGISAPDGQPQPSGMMVPTPGTGEAR